MCNQMFRIGLKLPSLAYLDRPNPYCMKQFFFIACMALGFSATCQVKFQSLTLNDALTAARKEGKLVFAYFVSESCAQCNDVADRAFADRSLGDSMSARAIAIRIEPTSTDRDAFINRYNFNEGLGAFFLRGDGDLVYRTNNTTSLGRSYIADLNKAWQRLTEGRATLQELDQLWRSETSLAAKEMNLARRRDLLLPLDSLLDVYVGLLPADSLQSFRCLQFISSLAPAMHSIAFQKSRADNDIFLQSWYRMPLQERIEINNMIVSKTLRHAVATKNIQLATQLGMFVWNINNTASANARRQKYDGLWFSYYQGAKDTANAIKVGLHYFSTYYMSVSLDSIRRRDSMQLEKALAGSTRDTIMEGNKQRITRSAKVTPVGQHYASMLSLGARTLYLLDSRRANTTTILAFAEKATSFYASPEAYEIYAKMMYLEGQKAKALSVQAECIRLSEKTGISTPRYQSTLAQMSAGGSIVL